MMEYEIVTKKWLDFQTNHPQMVLGDGFHEFITAAGEALTYARNHNDYGVLAGFATPDVIDGVSRIDKLMNSLGNTAVGGANLTVVTKVTSTPITYMSGRLKVRVEQWGRHGDSPAVELLWREMWNVTVGVGGYGVVTVCPSCGSPKVSGVMRCEYCNTVVNVISSGYKIVELRAT
jgi:hypothetical protein